MTAVHIQQREDAALGAAWRRCEAALGEGWQLELTGGGNAGHVEAIEPTQGRGHRRERVFRVYGYPWPDALPTAVEALEALADALEDRKAAE